MISHSNHRASSETPTISEHAVKDMKCVTTWVGIKCEVLVFRDGVLVAQKRWQGDPDKLQKYIDDWIVATFARKTRFPEPVSADDFDLGATEADLGRSEPPAPTVAPEPAPVPAPEPKPVPPAPPAPKPRRPAPMPVPPAPKPKP